METREELESRVAQLEKEVSGLRGSQRRVGFRKRAPWGIGDLPFYDIAIGPDLARGELRGHAKGVIAIGDMATGILAFGGLSRGIVAVGGLACGLVSFGGLSVGILGAIGGLAIGLLATGGAAVGGVAMGGGAVGYYACGAGASGVHVASVIRRDREAVAFFRDYGLSAFCGVR